VLSVEEKTTQPYFSYFQIADKYLNLLRLTRLILFLWRVQYMII